MMVSDLQGALAEPAGPVNLEHIQLGEGTVVYDRRTSVFLDVRRDQLGWALSVLGRPGSVRIERGMAYDRTWVVLYQASEAVSVAGDAHRLRAALDLAIDALTTTSDNGGCS